MIRNFLIALTVAGCGGNPPTRPTISPIDNAHGTPYVPPEPEVCDYSLGVGFWADDCAVEHCLPDARIEFFYSVNLGYQMGYSPTESPMFVATKEPTDTHCGPGITVYSVYRVSPNTYGDLSMVDPVRRCTGSKCDQVIEQGFAQAHPQFLYFIKQQSAAELNQ